MDLSVVVPTLNGREQLGDCLDALSEFVPDAEVVVTNGPSADGTTGMVQERDDVDVLVEVTDRNVNVARNAGLAVATGDVIALLSYHQAVEPSWIHALEDAIAADTAVVTGPTHRPLRAGMTTESPETKRITGREVSFFNPDNVAMTREAVSALDGFDETIEVGGARDAAHRLAGNGFAVEWSEGMSVRSEFQPDGGDVRGAWGAKYRSLAYRLFKNYGVRPTVFGRIVSHGIADAYGVAKDVLRGDATPTSWFSEGKLVLRGMAGGTTGGLAARARDRTSKRNPRGLSARDDRAAHVYDWRD
ncbi:MAG: glycosyltransferase [Halobacteriales archaeon]